MAIPSTNLKAGDQAVIMVTLHEMNLHRMVTLIREHPEGTGPGWLVRDSRGGVFYGHSVSNEGSTVGDGFMAHHKQLVIARWKLRPLLEDDIIYDEVVNGVNLTRVMECY